MEDKEKQFVALVKGTIEQFKEITTMEIAEDKINLLTDMIFNNVKAAVNGETESK